MADAILSNLKFRLSGGASNTDPLLSFGGAISSTDIISETTEIVTPISAVSIESSGGNGAGAGSLYFDPTGSLLSWASPGDTLGAAVDVSVTGSYTLFSTTNGYVNVTISGSLPTGIISSVVNVTQSMNNLYGDIDKADSLAGHAGKYRCLYIRNTDPSGTFYGLKVYIKSQPSGADSLEIAVDGLGISASDAETIADEDTAPAGEAFSTAAQGSPLIIGDLAAGQFVAIWLKRVVPANTLTSTPSDLSAIGIEVSI